MTAPVWAPTPVQVGAYVTSRTVDSNIDPGEDVPSETFTPSTVPSVFQVTQLITDSCAWVTSVTGVLSPDLHDMAAGVAAMRTAGLIELTYPQRNADVDNVAGALLAQAGVGRGELVTANRAAGQPGVTTVGAPVWGFPDPVGWVGDHPNA